MNQYVTDFEGTPYEVVQIGDQYWLSENIRSTRFQNGDEVICVTSMDEWWEAGRQELPACCDYDFKPENSMYRGKLYNWYAAADPRGIGPKGFHLPNAKEWNQLANGFGGAEVAGHLLKTCWYPKYGPQFSSQWLYDDAAGFKAVPGGWLYIGDSETWPGFENIDTDCFWWTTAVSEKGRAYCRHINAGHPSITPFWSHGDDKSNGLSVRCVANN